jgi:hypothetical protein
MADQIFKELAYAALAQTARNPTQDFLRATPRNSVLGYLADLTASTYAPQRTQQMQGIAQFLGVPAVSQTLDRLSYGEPLTTGAGGLGGTTRVRPEAIEAAMTVAPMVGRAAKATKGLPVGMSIKDVSAPQAEALRLAQQRAALPVEKGGLGLAADNTASQRAAAMGFDTDTYHGTDYDISKLDNSFLGSNTAAKSAKLGYFSAGHPRTTYAYMDSGVTGTDATFQFLYGKSQNQIEKELLEYANKRNLQPYQVRDEFYENLPNKYNIQLKELTNKRASLLKEIPGVKLMGRYVPNMDNATSQQKKSLEMFDDQIEELKAMADMAVRQPQMTNEIDDISEIPVNKLITGANIMPLKIKSSNANIYDDLNTGFRQETFANRMAETVENKKDLAIINNTQDGFKKSDTIYGVINPDIVRSRFAAFDPFRRTAATAATMGVAAPDLLAQEQPNVPEAQQRAMIMRDIGTDPYTIYQQTGVWLGGNE